MVEHQRYTGSMIGSGGDVKIRKCIAADAAALCDVFQESWRLSYRGIIPHFELEAILQRRGREWWAHQLRSGDGGLVIEVAGAVAGYATFGHARGRHRYEGEIYELYLGPTYQGLGFGEHLFEACRHALDERRYRGLVVWALSDNTPAVDFYWRRGGRPFAQAYDNVGGARLHKVGFGWA